MKKKKLVAILSATMMVCGLLAGCSTPTKETSNNATKKESGNESSTMEREKATVLEADKLPVKGIGAEITSDVKAKKRL